MSKETKCPVCGVTVTIEGQVVTGIRVCCTNCGSELEVIWLDPLELDFPIEEYLVEYEED